MRRNFGQPYIVYHQDHTTGPVFQDTSESVSTADESLTPWSKMYARDKYARDRVMLSARMLLPYLKDNDLILDVGCFTQEASKYYPSWIKYLGLDQAKYHKNTLVVDLNHGFEPVPAAHALCLETLEHLVDPQDCLESIYKSLPDGGLLVCSVPNEASLFHRLRCLCGVVDGECFSGSGKHLHLPALKQARSFFAKTFEIVSEQYYISPDGQGSRQKWVGRILTLIPDGVHKFLADRLPGLFARGFIFLLRKRIPTQPSQTA